MKNSIFILSIMAIFALSCSKESVDTFEDQNLEFRTENHMVSLMNNLTSSPEFMNRVNNVQARNNDNGNGLMVIQESWGLAWGILDGSNLYILGSGDGDGSIVELPNGEARFSAHSTNPSAAVLDFNTFATTYSSDCIENPIGTVNTNVTGTYETLVLPFGTIYFLDQASSANVFTGHCEVSDLSLIHI